MATQITHIGIVVHDLDAAVKLWSENFGSGLRWIGRDWPHAGRVTSAALRFDRRALR